MEEFMEDDDDDSMIECMELLDGNYQYYMHFMPQPETWMSNPNPFVRDAIIR